eukprot:3184854-Amphidinium_carterae.1
MPNTHIQKEYYILSLQGHTSEQTERRPSPKLAVTKPQTGTNAKLVIEAAMAMQTIRKPLEATLDNFPLTALNISGANEPM